MLQLIEQHRPEVKDLCRCHQVSQLKLFGSAVSGEFDAASSDLDFLVDFQPLRPGERADTEAPSHGQRA
jgi:predicted nucleotidyltransferase